MSDPFEINRRSWDERANLHADDTTGTYDIASVRAGRDVLDPIVRAEIGSIAGLRVFHLQCHIGTDTLSLAHRGAIVTGLDFSPVALEKARAFAAQAGVTATFVEGRVQEASRLAPGPFDLAFQTWGTLCWLADLTVWAREVAAVITPGGALYLADMHPAYAQMEVENGKLAVTFDRQTPADAPLTFHNTHTYTGDPTLLRHTENREWIHSLDTILSSLIAAGLTIVAFREHDRLAWKAPLLVPAEERMWRLPDGHPSFPLAFSLRAVKP